MNAVSTCFESVLVRTIFHSRTLLPTSVKDHLPTHAKSNIVYMYTCHCDQRYVGRTTQRLRSRVVQHVPRKLINNSNIITNNNNKSTCPTVSLTTDNNNQSAIKLHLLNNENCRTNYQDSNFKIIANARSDFHLQVLESIYIQSLEPILCRQKSFVYECLLF